MSAVICVTALTFNAAAPVCRAQTAAGTTDSSNSTTRTSPPASLSPDAVAPVWPPPATRPAIRTAGSSAPGASGTGAGTTASAGNAADAGNTLPANYDPLNPVTPSGEIDQRFLRWTPPKGRAPTRNNSQGKASVPGSAESAQASKTPSMTQSTKFPATTGQVAVPAGSARLTPTAVRSVPAAIRSTPTANAATKGNAPPVSNTSLPPVSPKPGSSKGSGVLASPESPAANQTLLRPQVPKIAQPVPAPDLSKGAAGASPNTANPASESANAVEKYPAVANLEVLTFGETHPALSISDRLANLETTVFKETHPTDSLFARTERLQRVLFGSEAAPAYEKPQYRPYDLPSYARVTPPAQPQSQTQQEWSQEARRPVSTGNPGEGQYSYFDEIAVLPENRVVVNGQQLQDYFLEMVNNERRKVGAPPLEIDPIAEKLATEHAAQLAERAQISHSNVKGENPDRRYTLLGGTDALTESLVSLRSTELGSKRLYRGAAAKLLRVLMTHQDDRDALTSRDSTHVGFAAEWTADRSRLIACAELVSKHAIIHPVPNDAHVDEKIDVKGVMNPPYQFVRVTLAWEGGGSNLASVADESEEALPYFPPLDYVAYQKRAESGGHDKAIMILKGVGIAAAIAGGVFMPPVALAAPLIAVSGSQAEHKPASEIPVKGGVKLEGAVFETRVPLSNDGKDGLYYLTVWGAEGPGGKPVPISRRVIYVTGGKEDPAQKKVDFDTGEVNSQQTSRKDENSARDATKIKKNKKAPPSS
ncbi:MAG: hypothetical protein IT342_03650 [Candidatus Melainabacteria bacterium]|nr:hypothetical protein [Candidatus Melainabacteria bacterium]